MRSVSIYEMAIPIVETTNYGAGVETSRRRWAILAVGTFAQAATCSFIYGIPLLVPALRSHDHLSLFAASLVVSSPIVGVLLTLIIWGAAADRFGERVVIASGMSLAALNPGGRRIHPFRGRVVGAAGGGRGGWGIGERGERADGHGLVQRA